MEILMFLKAHSATSLAIATVLQVAGTLLLSLFSFFGVKITASPNVRVNGRPVTHVEFATSWLNWAKAGLILLLVGILLAGTVSVAAA